jgi:hypothetical protein
MKGAATFGQIGSMAAITAESSDLSEQRRYLLDRYYDIPEGPEGDKEADAIKQELLKRAGDTSKPKHFFHWKSLLVCAAIGAALTVGFAAFGIPMLAEAGLIHLTEGVLAKALSAGLIGHIGIGVAGASAGALAGATIGIDRYYIRKWFDHTQDVVHSSSHSESALFERHKLVETLKDANAKDTQTKQQMHNGNDVISARAPAPKPEEKTAPAKPTTNLDKPAHTISQARRLGLVEIQRAMDMPLV